MINKFFRLARNLLKFPQCLEVFTSSQPDSDNYLMYTSQIQLIHKKKLVDKIKYQKSNHELKIVDYIQENDSLPESLNEDNLNSTNNKIMSPVKGYPKKELVSLIYKISQDKPNKRAINKKSTNTVIHSKFLPNVLEQDCSKESFLHLRENNYRLRLKKDSKFKNEIKKMNLNNVNEVTSKEISYKQNFKVTDEISRISSNEMSHKLKKKLTEDIPKISSSTKKFINESTLYVKNARQSQILMDPIRFPSSRKLNINIGPKIIDASELHTPVSRQSVLSTTTFNVIDQGNTNDNMVQQEEKPIEVNLKSIKARNLQINVQMLLIDQLRYGQYAFEALCLLSSIQVKNINPNYSEKICSYLLIFTNNMEAITKCSEPLLMIALAAELLMNISVFNQKLKYKAESVACEILSLGENIQSSIKNEEMLNYYLKEQCDHRGRNSLEIYAQNRFYSLLNDINIGVIVGRLWYGTGNDVSIFKFFRITRIFMSDISSEQYEHMIQSIYLSSNTFYNFQFYPYIKNCSHRFYFESFIVILITIFYQYIIYNYLTIISDPKPTSDLINKYRFVSNIANTLMCCSIGNQGFLLLFFYKTGRKTKINITPVFANIVLLIAVILNYIQLSELLYPEEENIEQNMLIKGINFSIIITMGWMKVILILMATNTFGPFFRIMVNITFHVIAFLIIVLCITFLFAQCFTVFFKNSNADFEEIYVGFITLFNTAFGQCNFDGFKNIEIFGYVALIIYTTISNIMLFNLIVAIIDNLFNKLKNIVEAENRATIIMTFERLKWDDRYGLFILLPTPFNIILIIMAPILLFAKDSVYSVNLLLSKISYVLIALTFFLVLVIVNIIAYPIALIKSLIHSTYDTILYSNDYKVMSLVLSFFTRPFMILFYLFSDMYFYWAILYKKPEENLIQEQNFVYLKKYILALRKVLNDVRYKEKKKVITISDLYSKLSLKKRSKCSSPESNVDSGVNSPTSPENIKSSNSSIDIEPIDKFLIQEEMKVYFRNLIDKVVDTEGLIDIERTLLILPERVRYCNLFIENIKHMNIRVLIRGTTKYFFQNGLSNSVYCFKRLQFLIFKLMIKFRLLYSLVSEKTLLKINRNFTQLNNNPDFEKTAEALQKYEERDDVSEYDDEGEYVQNLFSIEKKLSGLIKKSYLRGSRGFTSTNQLNIVSDTQRSGENS